MLLKPDLFHQIHDLSAVVHAVRDHVPDCAPECLFSRRIVQNVKKTVVITPFLPMKQEEKAQLFQYLTASPCLSQNGKILREVEG
jgi:hypothetical protein